MKQVKPAKREKETDRQIDRQTDRQTEIQTDRQTDRQRGEEKERYLRVPDCLHIADEEQPQQRSPAAHRCSSPRGRLCVCRPRSQTHSCSGTRRNCQHWKTHTIDLCKNTIRNKACNALHTFIKYSEKRFQKVDNDL